MHLVTLALYAALAGSSLLPAAPEKKKPPNPREVEVRLTDGSRVRMTILEESLDIVTKYGKLKVPATEIRRIEFGIRPTDMVAKRIDEAIKRLSSNVFKDREQGVKELVAIGAPAYLALYKASRSTDTEVADRARTALKSIREKVPDDQLRARDDDLVQTAEFTVIGKITTPTIKAESATFGEAQLKIHELRAIRWMSVQGEVEVVIDAAKYAVGGNQWLDTGIEVNPDDELDISASGQVDLMVNGGGHFTGPAGTNQAGGFGGRRGAAPLPGALLGRVGDSGESFVIGEKYKGAAKREGKLYLQISASPWINNGMGVAGSYRVKILGGRDSGDR
jgi:hypothetical protein